MSPDSDNNDSLHTFQSWTEYGRPAPEVHIAILNEQMKVVRGDITEIKSDIKDLSEQMKKVNDVAGKAKGVFFILLTIGSIISGIFALFDHVWKYFHLT